MCEDVARTVHIARQLGEPLPIAQADVDRAVRPLPERLRPALTRRGETACGYEDLEIWFLTGSQALYGEETLDQVADQSAEIAGPLDDAGTIPVRVVWKPVLTDADAIRRAVPGGQRRPTACIGVIAWMHTFSPAKMWIAGLDALRKPLLHLHTQANVSLPWATIDMDFMNLNQAAHGDREFGYIADPAAASPARPSSGHVERPGGGRADRRLGAGRGRLADGPLAAAGPLRRQHARRRRDRGRQGRGPAAVRRLGQHLRRRTTWSQPWTRRPTSRGRRAGRRVRGQLRRRARSCAAAASGTSRCGTRPGSSSACAASSTAAGSRAFTTNFEDLGGLRQLPGLAVQRLMADGYGFGGEGDWKTAALLRRAEGHGRRPARRHVLHGGLHLPPRARRAADPRRAHARGLPVHRRGHAALRDPPAGHRRTGRTRSGWCSRPRPGPAFVVGMADLGDRFRLVANEIDVVEPRRAAAPAAGGAGGVAAAAGPDHGGRGAGCWPAARTTPC